MNTPTGYRCTCSQGYELNENGISCTGMTVINFAQVEGVGEGGNYGAASVGSRNKMFGLSTELITEGKLATVRRFEC